MESLCARCNPVLLPVIFIGTTKITPCACALRSFAQFCAVLHTFSQLFLLMSRKMSNFVYDNPQLWQVGTRSALFSDAATYERVAMPPRMDNAQPRAEHKTESDGIHTAQAYPHACAGKNYRILSRGTVEIIIFALQMLIFYAVGLQIRLSES